MKKILCLFLACCISCMLLVLPASAVPVSSEIDMVNDFSHFISDVSDDYRSYKNGDISLDDFFNSTMTHATTELAPNICADITSIKDILRVMEFCGIDVSDSWEQFYYNHQMGGDGSGGNRDDSVLNGYSSALGIPDGKGGYHWHYGDSGLIRSDGVCSINQFLAYYPSTDITETFEGGSWYSNSYSSDYIFYGDWKYQDGTSADDKITELPEKEVPAYDDDSLTDDDLIDFFEDLLNELLMKYPDLSNIEGLLRAILAKLGTLDSDNDNELLCSILTAIQALKSSDNPETTEDLSKCLEDIKDDLVFNDGENSVTLAEQLNALVENQIKLSDITIDESLYNQRFELIQTKLLGKFPFISEMKNFIDYALDAYSSTTSPNISFSIFGNSYNIDFSAFDDSIELIRFCIAAFCYLSFAFVTFRKIPSYINGGDNT